MVAHTSVERTTLTDGWRAKLAAVAAFDKKLRPRQKGIENTQAASADAAQVEAMRDAIQELVFCGTRLDEAAFVARIKSTLASIGWPTSDDYSAAANPVPLTPEDIATEDGWQASGEFGWPPLLRDIQTRLERWHAADKNAIDMLNKLPPELVDDDRYSVPGRCTSLLREAIFDVEELLHSTIQQSAASAAYGVDVPQFVMLVNEATASTDPPRDNEQPAQDISRQARLDENQDAMPSRSRDSYSEQLIDNHIDDPSDPLTARQIAKAIWGKEDKAGRKRAREWMKKGKLPANVHSTLKDHYTVSKSALDRLAQIEGGKLNA